MNTVCVKCGGLLIGEWPMDFYQARHCRLRRPVRVSTMQFGLDGTAYLNRTTKLTETKKESNMEKLLGAGQSMKLVLCDCGGLRLSSGPMTIHFSREEFQAFAAAVGRLASIVAKPAFGETSSAPHANTSEVCH